MNRGRIGGLVGEDDIEVEEGGLLFKPRGALHALQPYLNLVNDLQERHNVHL